MNDKMSIFALKLAKKDFLFIDEKYETLSLYVYACQIVGRISSQHIYVSFINLGLFEI